MAILQSLSLLIQPTVQVLLSTTLLLIIYAWMKDAFKQTHVPEGKLPIPAVKGGLPFIGHGLYLFTDILKFVKTCNEEYGGIFSVKLFRTNIVILCDSALSSTYFKEQEQNLSLEHELRQLNFDWPFYETEFGLRNAISFFRKSIAVKYDSMIPKMESEARKVVDRLGLQCDKAEGGKFECSMEDEAYRFIARTSHACFISTELKDEVLAKMKKFFGFVNYLVLSSYFIPNNWMRWLSSWRVRQLRTSLTKYFEEIVQEYRDDPLKTDSTLIRMAVDFEDAVDGKLSNTDVADLIVGFMFVSSENTSIGLANLLTYMVLPENKEVLENLRVEVEENVKDTQALLKAPLLNACAMEMARLSAHLFAIQRKPMRMASSLGKYHIGSDVDSVALSGQMVMVHTECAERKYHDPSTFDPMRFLGKNKEPQTSPSIVTWGGGLHLCPGRMFALYEIKIALSYLVTSFNFELANEKAGGGDFDYFSPIAFAKKNVRVRISRRLQDSNGNNNSL